MSAIPKKKPSLRLEVLTSQSRFCDQTGKYVLYLKSHISVYICVQHFIDRCRVMTGE